MPGVSTKSVFVSGLAACVLDSRERETRRFLEGLSSDELRFIADFIVGFTLEMTIPGQSRTQVTVRLLHTAHRRAAAIRNRARREDRECKLILLMEYLSRCGFHPIWHSA